MEGRIKEKEEGEKEERKVWKDEKEIEEGEGGMGRD